MPIPRIRGPGPHPHAPTPRPGAAGVGAAPLGAVQAAPTLSSLSAPAAATPARRGQDPGWALGNLMLARSGPGCRSARQPGVTVRPSLLAARLWPHPHPARACGQRRLLQPRAGGEVGQASLVPNRVTQPLPFRQRAGLRQQPALLGIKGFPLPLAPVLSGSPLLPPARRAPRPSQAQTRIGCGVMERQGQCPEPASPESPGSATTEPCHLEHAPSPRRPRPRNGAHAHSVCRSGGWRSARVFVFGFVFLRAGRLCVSATLDSALQCKRRHRRTETKGHGRVHTDFIRGHWDLNLPEFS